MMLTPEELTQARALSSPEIPDDDETAKQPTRQLVRKMLAHIDWLTLERDDLSNRVGALLIALNATTAKEMQAEQDKHYLRRTAEDANEKVAERDAALLAKHEAEGLRNEAITKMEAAIDRAEKAEAETKDWNDCAKQAASESCPPDEKHCSCVPLLRKQVAKLQAIVDRQDAALNLIVSDDKFTGDNYGERRDAWIETARAALSASSAKGETK